jgi:hypothetical protein
LGKVAQHVRDEGTVPRINKEEDPDPEYSEYLEEAALIPNQAKVLVKDVKEKYILVEYGGRTGFVHKRFIVEDKPVRVRG